VICLIGIDGSGKTTHARKIISHLQKSGEKCRYLWFGTPYFLSYPFMVICRILGLTETHRLPNEMTCSEHQYYRNKPVALIWPWVQFLDLALFVFLQVYVSLLFEYTVVCDRFVYDILVEIMADVNDNKLHHKLIGRLILRLKPRSAVVFLMDVDEMTAFRRRYDVPNLRYLTRRRNDFRLIAEHQNIPIINANQPFFLVHKEITQQLKVVSNSKKWLVN
jgi:thymidylate kinase